MENNEIESEKNVEVAEQHDVLEDTIETQVEDTQPQTEEIAGETIEEETTIDVETPKQSEADNKAARLARKQAEKEAEARIEKVRKEAYEQGLKQGKIDGFIGKENPYTGNIIKDEIDAKEYQDMYQLDVDGSHDPVGDYRELQKARAREEAKRQMELDEELRKEQWFQDDSEKFKDKYGDEKLQEILKDKDFDIFAKGKVGKQPLAEIYEDFNMLVNKYKRNSIETAKKIVANNTATPGAINDDEHKTLDWSNMPTNQFKQYLQKAKDGELR